MSVAPLNIDQLIDDNIDITSQGINPNVNELMI